MGNTTEFSEVGTLLSDTALKCLGVLIGLLPQLPYEPIVLLFLARVKFDVTFIRIRTRRVKWAFLFLAEYLFNWNFTVDFFGLSPIQTGFFCQKKLEKKHQHEPILT